MLDRDKLRRYQQLAKLLIKYGRRDFIDAASAELGTPIDDGEPGSDDTPTPDDLVGDLTMLGPTFVKLAQMLSTRGDLLAPAFLDALSRLQDDVAPFDFEIVETTVTEELGIPLSQAYAQFERTPIAAASLGQVHAAVLRDGRRVAVKVQRPRVRERIQQDLEIFEEIAGAVDKRTELGRRLDFSSMVAQFRQALVSELDYRQEARNLQLFTAELQDFESIRVPEPIMDRTAMRVLTMEFIDGKSIGTLGPHPRAEIALAPLAQELCEAYLHQVLVVGCFHCDPHPGNLLVTDQQQIALIDLGMVAYVDPDLRARLLRLLLALCDGRGRETAELGVELGRRLTGADIPTLISEVSQLVARRRNTAGEQRKLGRTLLELVHIFASNGVRPPPEVSMLGKTLLMLDEAANLLDPDFDPDAVFDRYSESVLRRHLLSQVNPSQAFSELLDVQGFAQRLPRRIGTVLDALASGELRVRVDAFDQRLFLAALEKIGNRIALGLVLAALIVGAALVMQVPTDLRLFGYPALAIVLFLAAVVLGFGMVLSILVSDRRRPK